jgi:hypothetical protein
MLGALTLGALGLAACGGSADTNVAPPVSTAPTSAAAVATTSPTSSDVPLPNTSPAVPSSSTAASGASDSPLCATAGSLDLGSFLGGGLTRERLDSLIGELTPLRSEFPADLQPDIDVLLTFLEDNGDFITGVLQEQATTDADAAALLAQQTAALGSQIGPLTTAANRLQAHITEQCGPIAPQG